MDNQLQEPAIPELIEALNEYAQSIGHFGWQGEAWQKLSALRSKKYTWCGADENRMRFAIDNALLGRESQP